MMNFQDYVANKTDTVVLMSSLMQLPMLSASLGAYENRGLESESDKIIVMTANASSFEKSYDTLVPQIWGISRSQILVLDCLKIEGFGKEVCLSLGLFGSFQCTLAAIVLVSAMRIVCCRGQLAVQVALGLNHRPEVAIPAMCRMVQRMIDEHGQNVSAILMECTELPHYIQPLRDMTGLPIYDVITMIEFLNVGASSQGLLFRDRKDA